MSSKNFSDIQEQQLAAFNTLQTFWVNQSQKLHALHLEQMQQFNQQAQALSEQMSAIKDWDSFISAGTQFSKGLQPQNFQLNKNSVGFVLDSMKELNRLAQQQGSNCDEAFHQLVNTIEEKMPPAFSQPLVQTLKACFSNNLYARDALQKTVQQLYGVLEQMTKQFLDSSTDSKVKQQPKQSQ
jgi:hypothetical protein